MTESVVRLKCMDVRAWRAFTKQDMRDYFEKARSRAEGTSGGDIPFGSVLVVRQHLSPVDMYCYLKARFGEPNGVQNLLRKDDSDNWIHWDFNLKAAGEDVYVCGTRREVHFMLSEKLTDADWRDFILEVKSDFGRVAEEKGGVLNSLEKWVIFPNKFVEIATVCADLHKEIVEGIKKLSPYKCPRLSSTGDRQQYKKTFDQFARQSFKLYRSCLELSLLTPVLAEAFINMAVLILCKKDIRNNERQFDAFIRSPIDAKVFDLSYKCEGFTKAIDQNALAYKNFKRVMDKRNHVIHGNTNPEREQMEIVYFEGKRPLFKEPGDHIAKRLETLAQQYEPENVVKDYENVHQFLCSIATCLKPDLAEDFWRIMESQYPGYDLHRKITGVLLPEATAIALLEGVRYDDELSVSWVRPTE